MSPPPTVGEAPPMQRRKLDRYELIAEIASGGMGTVLLARLEGAGGFQRFFAIKMMHPHLVEDAQFVHMLLDEARVAARIHHPNVVATVDVCESPLGYYLVMDYVEGFTLTDVLADLRFAPREKMRIVNRVLLDAMAGLDAAHNLAGDDGVGVGIVHRDVSPQNVLVGVDGVARLTDFGIALAASRITSSRPGLIKGKPAYMAPEQARGKQLDRRADLFPLGVILWESLTNARLFEADSDAAAVLQVIQAEIPPPSSLNADVPAALDAVCMRALERDVDRRYASARAMSEDLERAASSAGLLASSLEVGDAVREVFASEIAHRRAAIRKHLGALGPGTLPVEPIDLFQMPKLLSPTNLTAAATPDAAAWASAARGAPVSTPLPPTRVAETVPNRRGAGDGAERADQTVTQTHPARRREEAVR
jgi:serine/threonine-protein kinase